MAELKPYNTNKATITLSEGDEPAIVVQVGNDRVDIARIADGQVRFYHLTGIEMRMLRPYFQFDDKNRVLVKS